MTSENVMFISSQLSKFAGTMLCSRDERFSGFGEFHRLFLSSNSTVMYLKLTIIISIVTIQIIERIMAEVGKFIRENTNEWEEREAINIYNSI